MSGVVWTMMRASGEVRTLGAWGVTGLTRTLQNLAEDFCEVVLGGRDFRVRLPFDQGEMVVVFRDGVRWFYGMVDTDRSEAEGGREGVRFRIRGPGHWLEAVTYRQRWRYCTWPVEFTGRLAVTPPDAGNPWDMTGLTDAQQEQQLSVLRDSDNYKKREYMSSVCILAQDEAGAYQDTRATILAVLAYAISEGAPMQVGTVDAGVAMPYDQIRDMTCMQVIRRLVQWTPDQGSWVDYSTMPPTFHLRKISNRVARVVTVAVDPVEGVTLEARHDLLVRGVTLNYLRQSTRAGMSFISMEQDVAGATAGLGVLFATVDLAGTAQMDAKGKVYSQGAPKPTGVAASLMAGYGFLYWQGRLTLAQQEVDGVTYLPRVVRVANGRPEWAGMDGVVQGQTDDVFKGRTVLQLGPPDHLSPQEFVARLQASRGLRAVPQEMLLSRVGGAAATGANATPAGGMPPSFVFGDQKIDLIMKAYYRPNCFAPYTMSSPPAVGGFPSGSWSGGDTLSNSLGTPIAWAWLLRHGQVETVNGLRVGVLWEPRGTGGVCFKEQIEVKNYKLEADGSISSVAAFYSGCLTC